ncbi:MAG: hypothetical protein K6E30_00400 [Lachnospiraceae bacterium]|nr:hypothetical protein [Lachnospiraceae bacterium]
MNSAEAVNMLTSYYKRYHFSLIAVIALLMTALALTFVNRTLSVVIGAGAFAFFLAVTLPARKKYEEETIRSNLILTIGRKISAEAIEARRVTVLTEEMMRGAELLPLDSSLARPFLAWGLSGKYAAYRIALAEVSLAQRIPEVPRAKSAHFSAGVWTRIELPFDSGRDFRLIDPEFLPEAILNPFLEKTNLVKRTAAADGGKKEFLFADKSGKDALPGGVFLKKLDELAAGTSGITALSLRGKTLDVFIRNRFLSLKVNARILPDPKLLETNPYPELKRIIELAMLLRQDA